MNSKHLFFFVILSLFLASCGTKKSIPEGMVPKEKMVNILLDIHVMESKIESVRFGSRDSMQVAYLNAQKAILQKHKVDSATYYKSYDYYFKEMLHMKDIYEQVAAKAKALMDEHNTKDSLAKQQPAKKGIAKPKVPVQVKLQPVKKKNKEEE
ncbi:hypothetical protein BKI52_44205 [marine bacterium AO1-C]|nr:hypothetical protein BKI52_44205 [marine bacterium AO1-C]